MKSERIQKEEKCITKTNGNGKKRARQGRETDHHQEKTGQRTKRTERVFKRKENENGDK